MRTRTTYKIGVPEIDSYISEVRSGKYPACKEHIALMDLVETAFQEENLRVDTDQLRRYLDKEKFFDFKLFPWEKFVFCLHNCVYREDGELRWPVLFCLLGRGAGKNGFISFESFSWLTPVNGVKHYNIDIFANSEDQARTSFDDVYNVLEDNKEKLKKFFIWNKEQITNRSTQSTLRYRTAGIKSKDGGRPGAIIFDEYHAYEDYRLISVATTGLGKRQHPRRSIITTDGNVRGGPLDDLKAQAEEVLFHGMADLGTLYFICKLDDEKEIDDEFLWHKANPSLRYFPTLKAELQREYQDYKMNPIGNSDFVTKRMNLPRTRDAQSVTDWEKIKACSVCEWPDLDFCDCVAGIDYMKTTDFLSAGLLWKYKDIYYWKQHTWICKQSVDLPLVKAPLEEWERLGYITFVDGPEIPPDYPSEWLEEQAKQYNITVLGLDNFRLALMTKSLAAHGFDVQKDGANNILLTKRVTQNRYAPVITSLFNTGRIKWGDDPMMAWYTWNATLEEERGNCYYGKKDPQKRKTDGFMALVSAICSAENLQDSADTGDDDFFVYGV